MIYVKEYFLKFNTYTQIQIGVIGVSVCIFFITICLLSIISLILINTTYSDIKAMLELKENDQINGVSIYVDTQANVVTELSKIYEFSLRKFIDNNMMNKDFIANFNPNKSYLKHITPYNNTDDTKKYIYENCFGKNNVDKEYENIKTIFAAYLQVIQYTHSCKFFFNDKELVYKILSFYSREHECLLYYPKVNFKKNYNLNNFSEFVSFQLMQINGHLEKYISNFQLNSLLKNLAINLKRNPITTGYIQGFPSKNISEFYDFGNQEKSKLNLIILSMKFKEFDNNDNSIFVPTKSQFQKQDIKDMIIFEISDNLLDTLLIKTLFKFRGFKSIFYNSAIIGKTSCGIIQKLYKNYHNDETTQIKLDKISDCFLFKIPNTNTNKNVTYFDKYLNNFMSNANNKNINKDLIQSLRRFVKIPIAYDNNYENDLDKAINYKILKFQTSDITTRNLINSFFTTWINPTIYILKNFSLTTKYHRIIYLNFLSIQIHIITVNLLSSFITLAIIICLAYRVSKSIGDPISKLINIVKNINPQKEKNENKKRLDMNNSQSKFSIKEIQLSPKTQYDKEKGEYDIDKAENNLTNNDVFENNENKNINNQVQDNINKNLYLDTEEFSKEKNLDNIKFEDDETINKFFNICKNLIKGGLKDENLKVKQKHFNDDAYNNISFMKSNNLIVQEDKIIKETENRSDKIFSHVSLIEELKGKIPTEKLGSSNNIHIYNNSSMNYLKEDLDSLNSNKKNISFQNNINNNINNKDFSNQQSQSEFNYNNNKNIIVNTKPGSDEIGEIRMEKQKNTDKPNKVLNNLLNSNKQLNSFFYDSPINSSIFINSEYGKVKYESFDLFPIYKEKKYEVINFFPNSKNDNNLSLTYDNINYMLHSNIEKKIVIGNENSNFNEETEFDKIISKHFSKNLLDKIFDLFANIGTN